MCVLKTESQLRFMDASRDSECPYCPEPIIAGAAIAGHYGIRWGHQACVIGALQLKELVLSPNNVSRRPKELELLANRRFDTAKNEVVPLSALELHARGSGMMEDVVEQEKLSRQMRQERISILRPGVDVEEYSSHPAGRKRLFEKVRDSTELAHPRSHKRKVPKKKPKKKCAVLSPETRCLHFTPQLIEVVTMPEAMRPSRYVIEEFNPCPEQLEEIVERMWKEYLHKRFLEHKQGRRHLPACSVHQWVPGSDLEVVSNKVKSFKWQRALWWVCQGDPQ